MNITIRKIKYLFLFLFGIFYQLSDIQGQNTSISFSIRDYKKNLSLSYCNNELSKSVLSETGSILQESRNEEHLQMYLYQGQEYDFELGVYFYPSRIYSNTLIRFFHPDPKSQYHSPYLFVFGDPVNYSDFDGKAGKPLVLYEQQHMFPKGMDDGLTDIAEGYRDAYYVPLNDFINGEVGDLPEWNGNVFVDAHMSTMAGKEIELERAPDRSALKLEAANFRSRNTSAVLSQSDKYYTWHTDGESMGKLLNRFSKERGVPIKNIVAGGCDGSQAAAGISKGFATAASKEGKGLNELKVSGLNPGRKSFLAGRRVAAKSGFVSHDRPRWHVEPANRSRIARSERMDNGQRKLIEWGSLDESSGPELMKYTDGWQFEGMLNGRIPPNLQSEFEMFKLVY